MRAPTPCRHFRANTRCGFTLIELLVASAITVVLAGIMIAIVAQVTRTWSRAAGGLGARRQADLVLDVLGRDLQSAVLRRDGQVWLAATIQPDQSGAGDCGGTLAHWSPPLRKPGAAASDPDERSLLLPPSRAAEDCRFGMAGMWLRLITPVSDRNQTLADTSAPRAVAYQIVRRRVSDAPGAAQRYGLFRSEVRPYGEPGTARERSTFAVGYDLFAAGYDAPGGGGNLGDAGTLRRPRRDLLLADDVVDFGVRFYRRTPTGDLVLLFPGDADARGFAVTTDTARRPANPAVAPAAMRYGFPDEAEVMLRVLTDEGARQIEAWEQGRLEGRGWWELALAHSVVVTRRVRLEAPP